MLTESIYNILTIRWVGLLIGVEWRLNRNYLKFSNNTLVRFIDWGGDVVITETIYTILAVHWEDLLIGVEVAL